MADLVQGDRDDGNCNAKSRERGDREDRDRTDSHDGDGHHPGECFQSDALDPHGSGVLLLLPLVLCHH